MHTDADSAFGIQFPDLPSGFSASGEADDNFKNAIEPLQRNAEDQASPDTSSHADIRDRDDVRAELALGAYLVSEPLMENDIAAMRVNVTFENGVLKAIDTVTKNCGLTRSFFWLKVQDTKLRQAFEHLPFSLNRKMCSMAQG